MVTEGYVPSCSNSKYTSKEQSNQNAKEQAQASINALSGKGNGQVDSSLPIGSMNSVDANGNMAQEVVYERFMFAQPKGRLYGRGDPIRGDLPIINNKMGCWDVHPTITTDLQVGAMNVLGGVDNETSRMMANLQARASGGVKTTIGGVDLSDRVVDAMGNMTTQYNTTLSNGLGDVQVTAFP